jgi:hypothetical protein
MLAVASGGIIWQYAARIQTLRLFVSSSGGVNMDPQPVKRASLVARIPLG